MAWILHTANKFEEALIIANKGIELDGNSFLALRISWLCYIALNRNQEAIDTLQNLMKISNRHQHALNSLIWAYCNAGNKIEARKLMNELEKRSETEYIGGTYAGISYAHLGDIDAAINHLENAYVDYDPILVQIKYSPIVPLALRADIRFQKLIEKMNYPE